MAYYEEYIREAASKAFDQDIAEFKIYDSDGDLTSGALDPQYNEELFKAAMNEMTSYLYEKKKGGASIHPLFDETKVENIYITARGLAAPMVVVEYSELPSWFETTDAELREFCWRPQPAHTGQLTAAYFQPRKA